MEAKYTGMSAVASSTKAEFPTSYRTQLRSCLVNFARAMVRLPLVSRAPARLAHRRSAGNVLHNWETDG